MRRIFSLGCIAATIYVTCTAQEQLTLQKCIELAKAFDLRSRASEKTIRASELSRDELLTTALPQVRISSSASLAPHSGTFGYDAASTDGGQLTGRVVVEQSLYDGGVRALKSSELGLERESLRRGKDIIERDLVFEVERAFIEVLRSLSEIALQEKSAGQLREYLDLVRRLAKGGGSSGTDILKTQVQLDAAERSLLLAQEAYALSKYEISELTGRAIDTAFSPVGSLPSLIPDNRTLDAMKDVSQYLDVATTKISIDKSEMETEISRRERLPVISAFVDAGVLSSGDNLRLPQSDRTWAYGYSVGVSLEIPLWTWGATDLRVQQRQLATDALKFRLEEVRRSVTTDYQKTLLQIARSEERLRSLQGSIKSAEENFELTRSKYAGGGALSLEVLSAQQLLTDVKLEELRTLAEQQRLFAKLQQIVTR